MGRDIKGSDRQEEPEPGEGADGANFGFLKIPTVRLVIEKGLLDIEAQPVFLEDVQTRRFITDNGPKLTIDSVAAKRYMHRAILLAFMKLDRMPTERLPTLKMNVSYVDFWCMEVKEGRAYPAG